MRSRGQSRSTPGTTNTESVFRGVRFGTGECGFRGARRVVFAGSVNLGYVARTHPHTYAHPTQPERVLSRRALLIDLGGAAAAALVLSACASDTEIDDVPTDDTTAAGDEDDDSTTATSEQLPDSERWQRTDLGFVSAYVLVQAGAATIVDSGPSGSEGAIADTLAALGSGWSEVSDVILTHRHGDHIGSLGAVAEAAAQAALWAGIDDVDAIGRDLGISGVADRDQIAGLTVIATPGHTPGHISILDPAAGVLVAGDALNGENGGVTGPNPQFTSDMDIANASVAALAGFDYQTIYFGHGEPVRNQGSDLVAQLAAAL